MSELYIGLMSGTSADGVDAVLVEFPRNDASGFNIRCALTVPYEKSFREQLLQLAMATHCNKSTIAEFGARLADVFACAVQQILHKSGIAADQINAIGSHGHTLDHAPDSEMPYSWQITDHARLTEKTGITSVCDFRSRDIAAGGQGAPLVPAFHRWLMSNSIRTPDTSEAAVINIGGISNLTLIRQGLGFDCGPGNCLIDEWHDQHTGEPFDSNGDTARQGQLIPELLTQLRHDTYFSRPPPKSTGREYFNLNWLNKALSRTVNIQEAHWQDIAYTLTALTATTIADTLHEYRCDTAFLCGGGSHNHLLTELIRAYSPKGLRLRTTSDLGIAPDWIEATAFAWLAQRTLHRQPGNLPSATGAAGARILGAIYPA